MLEVLAHRVERPGSEHEISQEGELCFSCAPVNVALQEMQPGDSPLEGNPI